MIQIHDLDQGTEEWHKIRDGKFTGSNAHKLLGSFGASEYAKAMEQGFAGNFYTKRGHILEDEAIELYEQIKGISVARPGFVTNTNFPECGYSPDGLTDSMVIEVKCFNEIKHMEIYNAKQPVGEIPLKILAQIHFGMLICGKKLAHLVIYNPDLDAKEAFKVIEIKANRNIVSNFKRILAPKEPVKV